MSAFVVFVFGPLAFIPMVVVAVALAFFISHNNDDVKHPLFYVAGMLFIITSLIIVVSLSVSNPIGAVVAALLIIIVSVAWYWSKKKMGLSE